MKKYDNYKDSSVDWIGEIPFHWELKRMKFCVDKHDDTAIDSEFLIAVENIESGTGKLQNLDKEQNFEGSITAFKEGDVIFNKLRPYLAKVYRAERDGGCFGELLILRGKEIYDNDYLYYLVFSKPFIDTVDSSTQGTKMPRANWDTFIKQIQIPVPNKYEQTVIAKFLDHKTTQIDDLIAKKERLIQLLEEERTSIINQAVTKGLDPTVTMKDSGIECLGEIPEHWEVIHVKHVANIQGRVGYKGYTVSDLVSEGEGPYTIGAKHINKENQLDLSNPEFISWEKYYESPEIMVKKGDLLLTQRGTLGKVVYINNEIGEATINPSMVLLNKLKVEADYLYFFFNSYYFKSWIEFTNTATAVPMISQEQLGNFKLILPPVEERKTLLKVMNSKLEGVNKFKETVTKEIEFLKEYKTALISEVVTGKVDVRDYSEN